MFRLIIVGLVLFTAVQRTTAGGNQEERGKTPSTAPAKSDAPAKSEKVVFYDDFSSGDMSATNKDGFSWSRNNRTSVVTMDEKGPLIVWNNGPVRNRPSTKRNWKAHDGKYALRFRYPAGKPWSEQRFTLGKAYPEIWFRFWLRVPENYQHGPKTASNNKFFALWMDGYSTKGDGPTVVWNFWRQPDGNSAFTFSHTKDPVGLGHHGKAKDFLVSPRDRGRWMQIVLYAKMSSSPDVNDGEVRIWRRWEGKKKFKLISKSIGRGLHPSKDKSKPQGWAVGYVLGWSNATYKEETEWLLDGFTVSSKSLLNTTK